MRRLALTFVLAVITAVVLFVLYLLVSGGEDTEAPTGQQDSQEARPAISRAVASFERPRSQSRANGPASLTGVSTAAPLLPMI